MSLITKLQVGTLVLGSLAMSAGCGVDDPPSSTAADSRLPVVFEGKTYTAAEFDALALHPVHFGVTKDSIRDGYVLAFLDAAERDARVSEGHARSDGTQSILRHNSKFYRDVSFNDKVLELGPGEAALDLSGACNCLNQISSLKASDDALITRVFDLINLGGDSFGIATGAEISDLGPYTHNGFTWDNDINSIEISP
ncbi:MAG TPA: hypothetical protein VFT22_24075 [Kofleriaceae bacterium]|nr:hypothetical protein [Kofleriaceae bacterium]